ncbi:MAG: hypothetical protein ACF8OB_17565 [Phycisphaeraceae bacterium JB051]
MFRFGFCNRVCFTAVICLLAVALLHASPFQAGDRVYQLDMQSSAVQSQLLIDGAQWVKDDADGQTCYQITVGKDMAPNMNASVFPIDLTPYRGLYMQLSCQVKAIDVTQPRQSWNGIKCMLNYKTPTTGEHWHNQGNVFGSFDWKTINANFMVPNDATTGQLLLGLQDCTGTAWIKDVRLTVLQAPPSRPKLPANPGPAYKGHNLPRLRGVMSPQKFREQDFVDLEKWNVNVVRWQMTRHWGKANTDLDLDEYDNWIDAE